MSPFLQIGALILSPRSRKFPRLAYRFPSSPPEELETDYTSQSVYASASLAGIAKPLLTPALTSTNHVIDTLRQFESELRTTMFCTNSASLGQLTQAPLLKDPTKN